MMRTLVVVGLFTLAASLLSSCGTTTGDILKALHIESEAPQKSSKEQGNTVAGLEKKLAAAKQKEANLAKRVAALQKQLDQQEAVHNDQLAELKNSLDEKEAVIALQGKVIGLLDDADQTLQKSIEAQLRKRQPAVDEL